jgi:hypothetical protein
MDSDMPLEIVFTRKDSAAEMAAIGLEDIV